ncbi:MAG TPA: YoaK family protein, partial [Steroidobacteraceae bacterium]|nr:YoaK family protein [Steroidobacteraceae bacterium]
GFMLAFNAGFINAVGLLGFKHQAVSHLTGTSTFLSLAITNSNFPEITHLLLVMVSFILGAAYSGLVIGNTALKLGRHYSAALLTESALLFIAMYMLNHGSLTGHFFASAACGLQNAMTSAYSGAVVRTTHVSGLFTDLGAALGLRLRGHKTDSRKIVLYSILISGFVVGGIAGSWLFAKLIFTAILVPCMLTAVIAIGYWVFLHHREVDNPGN